jgi:diguanylate cyclase (GGDEF)-like protein
MADQLSSKKASFIENALKSLYQLVVVVDEESSLCDLVDVDDSLLNLSIKEHGSFDELCSFLYKNLHPEDRERFDLFSEPNRIHDVLSKEISISMESRIRHTNSRYYWSEIIICNARRSYSAEGKDYLFLIRDIDKIKRAQIRENKETALLIKSLQDENNRLFIENMTDQQTGCYNRKGLKYYEELVLENAKDPSKSLFVCVLDLNGLKYLNDTYGHAAGDEAIKAVSDALKASVPEGSSIIRTGGDEFLILCALDSDSSQPAEMGGKIEKWLDDYNSCHDNPFMVAASYGYVFEKIDKDLENAEKYIEIADKKMYRMKEETDPYKR